MPTYKFIYRQVALAACLILIVPVVAACGGTPPATTPPVAQATAAQASAGNATAVAPATSAAEATSASSATEAPAAGNATAETSGASGTPVKLVLLTHWGTADYQKILQPIFDEYHKQNPNVTIEHQTVAFDDLLKRITTGRLGGVAPDIYHFYNLWLPEFAGSDLLSDPPPDVAEDIKAGYSPSTVEGVSYNGRAWGYATEVNTYQLIYNKKLLKDAGIDKAPETWDELRTAAQKTTKKGADGKITQAGFMLLKGWDSGVVHPFSALLWSNGGAYVSKDGTKAAFNDPAGVQTLELEHDLIKSGSVDLGLGMPDFVAGKIAMTIMANWWGADLRKGIPGGIENVGVAPIPHSAGGKSATLQYNWLWGVDKNSKNAAEAWKFLKWLNSPQGGGSTPMGKFLTSGLNAIPGRQSDQKAYAAELGDPFVKPFVDALQVAHTEPIIPGAQEIKTALQKQIEAAWFDQKAPKEALGAAAEEANRILAEKGKQ